MLVRRFPLGVLSLNGQVAYIGDELPDVIAIDIASGRIRWHATRGGRPIAATSDRVVVANAIDDNVLELVLLSHADGQALASVPIRLTLPQWVRVTLKPGQGFGYRCDVQDATLTVAWHAARHYEGGAPPTAAVLARNTHAEGGAFRIDLNSGQARAQPGEAKAVADEEPAATVPNEANTREACVIGARVYYLADRTLGAASGRTTLCAADQKTGAVMWELPVREWQVSRPRALRP